MGPGFSTVRLDQISPTVESYLKKLVERIQEEADENNGIVDIKAWFFNFTFTVYRHLVV
jgi:hypothetical protein